MAPKNSLGLMNSESFRNQPVEGSWGQEHAVFLFWFGLVWFFEHPQISFLSQSLRTGDSLRGEARWVPVTRAITQGL